MFDDNSDAERNVVEVNGLGGLDVVDDEVDAGDEERSDSDETSSDEEVRKLLDRGKKRKRRGRRSNFPAKVLDDLVDVIISSEIYKKKLLYENTKKKANSKFYDEILKVLIERANAREETCDFNVTQIRNKFKQCVSTCKKASLTIKTKSGIERFRDDKGFGAWFDKLYPYVKARDSCQPERAIEPSDAVAQNNENSAPSEENSKGEKTFVPRREKKVKKEDVLKEMVTTFNKIAERDDSRELLDFMREDNEKRRQHEMEMQRTENASFLEVMRMMMQSPQSQSFSYTQGMHSQQYQPYQQYQFPHTSISSPLSSPGSSVRSPEATHVSGENSSYLSYQRDQQDSTQFL